MYFIKLLFAERFHGCALESALGLAFRASLQNWENPKNTILHKLIYV